MKIGKEYEGEKVRAVHTGEAYAPSRGAIGVLLEVDLDDSYMPYHVQWDEDGEGYPVWCFENSIELVKEEMQRENPVWKMLEPKMTKNGFTPANYPYDSYSTYYYSDEVHRMVELAYTCGYQRAKKGKPFEYKKATGHWEKVDINNLPEEGAKVRFARESKEHHLRWSGMKISDLGTVEYRSCFGVAPTHVAPGCYEWVAFSNGGADSLDVWVEDAE